MPEEEFAAFYLIGKWRDTGKQDTFGIVSGKVVVVDYGWWVRVRQGFHIGHDQTMPNENAITVRYWVPTDQHPFPDLEGITDFRKELSEEYVSVVQGRPAGAGGLVHLHVELFSTFSLNHLVQLLIDGVAFDLIKSGAEAFVLRPFIKAYERFREKNKKREIDIGDLRIEFQDSILVLYEISSSTLLSQLEGVLSTLARSYQHLVAENGDPPFEIHIPVFEDLGDERDRSSRFRLKGDIDETIKSSGPEDYFRYWGLTYDPHGRKVFDVNKLVGSE